MLTSSPLGRTSPRSVGGADGNTAASPGASCATAGSPFGANDARVERGRGRVLGVRAGCRRRGGARRLQQNAKK
jgi:hypothetical protein